MIFLGIDPGMNGGIAVIGDTKYMAIPMPDTEKELWDFLHPFGTPSIRSLYHSPQSYAILEKVGGVHAKHYGRADMGHTSFVFGKNYGICLMALIAAGIHYDLVHPRTWQKHYSLRREKSEKNSLLKGRIKEIAKKLFPKTKVTLKTADALLIAEYGRRTYG